MAKQLKGEVREYLEKRDRLVRLLEICDRMKRVGADQSESFMRERLPALKTDVEESLERLKVMVA